MSDSIPPQLAEKQASLLHHLRSLGSLLVAYSGGVDSAFLAWSAHHVLGDKMLAVIADSPSLARTQLADATAFAAEHLIPLQVIRTAEIDNPDYRKNDAQRCFHCKDELFSHMEKTRAQLGFSHIAYGRNLDDSADFRPGQLAAALHHAVAPLAEAQLTKEDIRVLAHASSLSVWDKPASPCLSSRVEYGRAVTPEVLQMIESAEDRLRSLGYRELRVRHHGDLARVELSRAELANSLSINDLDRITNAVRASGYQYVTLDTAGFRSGSMNELLPIASLLASR